MATATVVRQTAAPARIASLDGWRGIAILLVLIDHTQAAFIGGYAASWTQSGQHGVTLFFVLSGFLITGKLMEGQSLGTFYTRRLFRLMPVAWAYLALMGILHLIHTGDALSCLFFFRNYSPSHQIVDGHFWSLSVEEQFYLLWPCVLILFGLKRSRWAALIGVVACASYRFARWGHYNHMWLSFRTEVRIDALLIGCLLALTLPHAKRICARLVIPALLVFAFCIAKYPWLPPFYEAPAIAIILGASASYPNSLIARAVSFRPLQWLGLVSYSVYVWQEVFFMNRGFSFTVAMVCIMPIFAVGSYYFLEQPGKRLGYKLTSDHRALT